MNSSTPLIRPATLDDVEALARLATELGYPASPGQMDARMRAILAEPGYVTLVAEVDGAVVGFAGVTMKWSYTEDVPRGQLLALVVSGSVRGQGTGAALVAAAEAWIRERGGGAVHLTTALHRERAHVFYERLGYARTGLRYVKKLGTATGPDASARPAESDSQMWMREPTASS